MIRYHVTLSERQAHRAHVRISIPDPGQDHVDLSMPVWTPGSYLVREFARHVLDLQASADDGTGLPTHKLDKNTWRIACHGATAVHVEYALHANELSVRTNHVDAYHAFLSPPATFLRWPARADSVHHVSVDVPPGWHVFTGLEPVSDGWIAGDYDTLADSPLEVGPHRVLTFEQRGIPHRLVLAGSTDLDDERLRTDVALIMETAGAVFDSMPFAHYTFILWFTDGDRGGLEHGNSSVCMVSRWGLGKPDDYRRLLSLLAHEYLHAWNVKRFRPEALGPFDYDGENYTRELWVAEGITSYYDDLCTLRAGFAESVDAYLGARAEAFQKEAEQPGNRRMSLEDSSFDAWIKLYRPDENSVNSTVSYYTKGALVALMLDLEIARASNGRASLADVLRMGWARYAERGVGFPPGAFQTLASEAAGTDLAHFFRDYVAGTVPLDPDPGLAWVGLRLAARPASTERLLPRDGEGFALERWLGMTTSDEGGHCRVDSVVEGGPAYRAGLGCGDLLLAVDDMRVRPDTLLDRLDRCAGAQVRLTFFRGQTLRSLELTPETRRLETWRLVSVDAPTEQQKQSFRAWTGWAHPSMNPPDA